MTRNERHYNLPGIIGNDLLQHAKIIVLLFFVQVSAILVATTVHKTRLLTAQKEQLFLECEALDIEWRNLILEENVLSNHSRIERIAKEKLQMQHVDPAQEKIILQP